MPNHLSSRRPQVLLVGNGINLAFKDPSWEKMIQDQLQISGINLQYEDIKRIPPTMQIVIATQDQVNLRLKGIARALESRSLSKERAAFLNQILSTSADAILTTNYSFELERAAGFNGSVNSYRSKLIRTHTVPESQDGFRLYQYYPIAGSSIWHIHGDIAKPKSMVMGHYYYGKLLRDIQVYVASFMRSYHEALSKGVSYEPKSWIDYFLLGDIYIVGLGLYLCESDLWWLLCCKKRNFPETHVYYYGELDSHDERRMLLETYNGQVQSLSTSIPKSLKDSLYYLAYYKEAFKQIEESITNHT